MRTRSPIGWPKSGEKITTTSATTNSITCNVHTEGKKEESSRWHWRKKSLGNFLLSFLIVCWLWEMASPPLWGLILFPKTPRTQPLICLRFHSSLHSQTPESHFPLFWSRVCSWIRPGDEQTVYCPYPGLDILSWRSLSALLSFF